MNAGRQPSDRTIRALGRVIDVVALTAVIYAFTVALWLGAVAVVAWFLLSELLPLALLGPFFGVGRVRDARLGPMVSGPTEAATAGSPLDRLVGASGEVTTDLAPEGFVEVDGRRWAARCDDEILAAGTAVRVVASKLDQLVVVRHSAAQT